MITPELSDRLVIVSENLLQWAHDSSKEFFSRQEKQQASGASLLVRENSATNLAANTPARAALSEKPATQESGVDNDKMPCLKLGPSPYVLLESAIKQPVQSALTLENLGSATLSTNGRVWRIAHRLWLSQSKELWPEISPLTRALRLPYQRT